MKAINSRSCHSCIFFMNGRENEFQNAGDGIGELTSLANSLEKSLFTIQSQVTLRTRLPLLYSKLFRVLTLSNINHLFAGITTDKAQLWDNWTGSSEATKIFAYPLLVY